MYLVGGLMVSGAGIQAVQAVFLLLLVFVAMFAGLARRLKVPYPILLVIAGLLLSFLPGMPRVGLDPDLVFLVFLPPLLYSAAWTLSWREFQRNFVSIAMLAVGLVLFTVVGWRWRQVRYCRASIGRPRSCWVLWWRQRMRLLRHQLREGLGCRSASWTFWKRRAW
jgi:hypothetical protein